MNRRNRESSLSPGTPGEGGGEGSRDAVALQVWRQRRAVVFAWIVALIFCLFLFTGPSALTAIPRLMTEIVFLFAWLISAFGFGSLVPLPDRDDDFARPLGIVTRIALGIGILSLFQLGLGLAGFVGRVIASGVILVGIVIAVVEFIRSRPSIVRIGQWFFAPASWEWLWLLTAPMLAFVLVAALAPPGILWGDEPNGYDVVEYHFQLPREWYDLHRITALHHNVFSYFPLGMEMNYMLAMQLRGGAWRGMYLAQLMHVATIVLCIAAIYSAGLAITRTRAGPIAAAVAATSVPWLALLAPIAYNEGALFLFATVSIAWVLLAIVREKSSIRPWLIAGIAAGFTCGVKLTAVPMLLVCLPLAVLLFRPRAILGVMVFVMTAAAVFSPWLIRNQLWAKNPVFPEATSVLGKGHFTDVQVERWRRAHSATEAQQSLRSRHAAFLEQIVFDWRFGWTLLPMAALAIASSAKRRETWLLAGLLVLLAIFWMGFTHLQGRFFVLAIPIIAILIALTRNRLVLGAIVLLTLIQLGVAAHYLGQHFVDRIEPLRRELALGREDLRFLIPQEVEDKMPDPTCSFALVGDVRPFLYQVPMSRLHYRTVFDVNAGDKSVIDAWLEGVTGSPYVVIDPIELDRLAKTYYWIKPLPEDVPFSRDREVTLPPQSAINAAGATRPAK